MDLVSAHKDSILIAIKQSGRSWKINTGTNELHHVSVWHYLIHARLRAKYKWSTSANIFSLLLVLSQSFLGYHIVIVLHLQMT